MTISSLPFLFLSVFFPRPVCWSLILSRVLRLGHEALAHHHLSGLSHSAVFPAPGSVSPCPPCPGLNWNVWLAMSSQACYGLPTLSLWYFHNATNCHCHPGERTNNTFLQSQVTQCKSRQVNSSWHSFKYWPWEPTSQLRVCLSWVRNRPTDLKSWSGEYRPIRNIMLLSGVNVGVKVCHSKMCSIKTS